jgi:hypothetical protein
LFFIKKKLGFGTVRVQDKQNKTHCFKVNNKNGCFAASHEKNNFIT